MKTSGNFAASIFILSAAFVLTLTSCQKDELLTPNAATTPQVDQAANINPAANKHMIMTIQHATERKYKNAKSIFANEYEHGDDNLNRFVRQIEEINNASELFTNRDTRVPHPASIN